jgi:uncharacterized protein with HEPN domain
MRRDPHEYLWDAYQAGQALNRFREGKSFADYEADEMLRSAVERQFEIVGEALNQLSQVNPELASRIPQLRRIVGFRNVLIHGYAAIEDAQVWQTLATRLPELQRVLRELLDSADADQT